MGMSDCIHCWSTPCDCGWEYRYLKIMSLKHKIKLFKHILKFREDNPSAVFSKSMREETEDDEKFLAHMRPLLIKQNEEYSKQREIEIAEFEKKNKRRITNGNR